MRDTPLPPEPMLTRLGILLVGAQHYSRSFETIEETVNGLTGGGVHLIRGVQAVPGDKSWHKILHLIIKASDTCLSVNNKKLNFSVDALC